MKARTSLLCAAVACLIVASAAAQTGGWWDDVFEQKTVTLDEIINNPIAFRGLDVSFVAQFNHIGSIDNPFYTKFEKERYINFSVWSDTAPLWKKKAYKADFPFMFIDRIETETQTIIKSKTYDRFIFTARVESIFRGRPWIEVTGLKKLDTKLSEPTLIHMVKAFKLKNARRYDAAAAEFHLAATKHIPTHVRSLVFREHGTCLVGADRFEEALRPLRGALALAPKDKGLIEMIDRCRESAVLVKQRRAASSGGKSGSGTPKRAENTSGRKPEKASSGSKPAAAPPKSGKPLSKGKKSSAVKNEKPASKKN